MRKAYVGATFCGKKQQEEISNTEFYTSVDVEKLIQYQTELLMKKYNTACIDVKQLQEVLNVGETNAYDLLKENILPVRTIGRRKVVPAIAVATYLVKGTAA